MAKDDSVQVDEVLYRAVLNDGVQYTCEEDEITIESPAFKGEEPSVGRAKLVNFIPALYLSLAKLNEKSGVVSLNAGVVCEIELKFHTVDVILIQNRVTAPTQRLLYVLNVKSPQADDKRN